jgi:hypothetical protein
MTDHQTLIPMKTQIAEIIASATAYAPLPVDPSEERTPAAAAKPRPAPRPAPPPDGPAYPSLPIEPDTRDGGGESK